MPIGNLPTTGFQPVDNDWLNGLAGGHNQLFQNGLTAVGTNQATSLQLVDRIAMFSIDTAAASTGVALPAALAGVTIFVANNAANNITVFPSIANNPVTAAQDTINNGASATVNSHTGTAFTCAKNGTWYTN
jgi:hypothetical protein